MTDLIAWIIAGFSALQRAEKSSIIVAASQHHPRADVSVLFSEPKIPQFAGAGGFVVLRKFQCSSASRKFLNRAAAAIAGAGATFQCSSASRKFLNCLKRRSFRPRADCFSALQRAENSSIRQKPLTDRNLCAVSVLFSEPKIPQFNAHFRRAGGRKPFQCSSASRKFLNHLSPRFHFYRKSVSVLFSAPKIPQW